ncbi:MAG: exodeoxyribonuclease VII large subunit [Chromatiales bacterium]|jgi:exodeoxyribonuclease VII large subunit
MTESPQNRTVYSVSRLNTEVRQVLESSFPLVWVEGEVSNLSTPRSGHLYFSLKDEYAQTRCAMFRMKRQLLRFAPADGMQVLLRARITLYEARGDFQLVVEHMEPAGEGRLRQAVEQLKAKLSAEGLFDAAHKKDLPAMPLTVGVVTSPSGAAITDILHVFKRRFPAARIIIYPVPVQGETAAAEISAMLRLADRRQECDLLILARGGGSLEDLMTFNDEGLARTIFALQTPIISAVGHEIDTSISDFVADRRAPTPSAAAELASTDQQVLLDSLRQYARRLQKAMLAELRHAKQQQLNLRKRLLLQSPEKKLQARQQRLDEADKQLMRSMQQQLAQARVRLQQINQRLLLQSPQQRIRQQSQHLLAVQQRLHNASPQRQIKLQRAQLQQWHKQLRHGIEQRLLLANEKLRSAGRTLESVSPLATLSRGYAIVRDDQGNIVRQAPQVKPSDTVDVLLHQGSLRCEVLDSKD